VIGATSSWVVRPLKIVATTTTAGRSLRPLSSPASASRAQR
jgi:hypothetical protein